MAPSKTLLLVAVICGLLQCSLLVVESAYNRTLFKEIVLNDNSNDDAVDLTTVS